MQRKSLRDKIEGSRHSQVMQGTRRFSTKLLRGLTTKPKYERKRLTLNTEESIDSPGKIPSFSRVACLNNHCFSVGTEEYEFVGGQYYKKTAEFSVG